DQAFYSEKLVKKTTLEKILTPYKGKSGYGWGITKYADHKLVVKGGALHGFSAIMSRFPDDELCVVFLANVDNYTLFHGPDVSRAIMLDQPYTLPEERKIVKVDKKIYQKLVGVYEMDPGVNIKITIEDNTIFLYYPHGEKTEIFPTSDYTYYIKVANTELQFLRDDKNNITSLRIYGNFAEKICKKIK
ncbi:MAG: DUF3471 domain-containing protein, partial [Bacteroidia bacterium]